MKIIKKILIAVLSTLTSFILLLLFLNYYLKITDRGKDPRFLGFTIDTSEYSTRYLFWEKAYCTKEPSKCEFPEERVLPYPIEVFTPNNEDSCDNPVKIMFLGDSFIVAPWTIEGNSLTSFFSKKYSEENNVCVHQYRLATSGSSNDQQYAAFLSLYESLKPDIVIWQFYWNDYYENVHQSLFTIKNNNLKKENGINNFLFIAGYINQYVPFIKNSTLGNHLLYLGETKDIFNTWSINIYDQNQLIKYNELKIKLFLSSLKRLSSNNKFKFFTFLAPLECEYNNTPCGIAYLTSQNSLLNILSTESNFIYFDLPKKDVDILGYTTENNYSSINNDLFETEKDKGLTGARHLSESGNKAFGENLFKNFRNQFSNN